MTEFYKNLGYNAYYMMNNVKSLDIDKEEKNLYKTKQENQSVNIGIYNAHSRELKNIYTQILATTFLKETNIDIVPISKEVKQYLKALDIKYTCIDKFIPTEELMKRIKRNDINIYVTFTECSPMFPMESFEQGVPCLIGNNNDYFLGSKLRDYVCVNREDDPREIRDKITKVIENKEEVLKLYREWKNNFNNEVKKQVKEFLEG
jgi:hypothetical protein